MEKIIRFIFLPLLFVLSACEEQSKDLNVEIKKDQLCIFTNKPKNYGEDDFLVHMGKIDFSKEYKSEYEKTYDKSILPVEESNCVYIPLNKIKKDTPYKVTLSTINSSFSAHICVHQEGSQSSVKYLEAGIDVCK
ncbi:NF045616 family extracytoplasmic (lipo)protein [Acinetobacter calcoaceticus]|uniref:NF045616 family extracytoplasmic (lipo)protein n=1 Tax=Acinetobacter calcoaceticus TaxID=471 RepID=UPI003F7C61FB